MATVVTIGEIRNMLAGLPDDMPVLTVADGEAYGYTDIEVVGEREIEDVYGVKMDRPAFVIDGS
jgi:hypothetical protein